MKSGFYSKAAVAVIILGILLRAVLSFTNTISGDACWHDTAAKFIAEEGKFPLYEQVGRDEPFWPPPLFHIITAFFYSLFGEPGLKIAPFLFGSLALIFSYKLLRKMMGETATFYATLFMAFIPIAVDYSVLGYVDSIIPFFTIAAIYFAIEKRFVMSGVMAGLGILAKYNVIFLIPVLMYIAWTKSNKDSRWKNVIIVTAIPIIISLPWFIRNWVLLHNPIWPFLNFVFHGYEAFPRGAYSGISLVNLSSIYTYVMIYLGFFGVPDGAYWLFFFYNIPYIWILISLFLAGTLIFVVPLFFGFGRNKHRKIFYVLIASFMVLFFLFELNVRPAVSRIMLPALIGAAFVYGNGMEKIMKKYPQYSKIINIVIIVAIVGFIFAESIKFTSATKSWNFYKDDFEWIKSNTDKDSVFLMSSQCIPLRIDRKSVFPSLSIDSNDYDYVWVNQDFRLEPQSRLSDEYIKKIESKNPQTVYSNNRTKTSILKVQN